MLNPDVVAALRAEVREAPGLVNFRGRTIRHLKLVAAEPAGVQSFVCSDLWTGQLRPPARIFGVPEDASCMDGIRPSAQTVPKATLFIVPNARVIGNNFVVGNAGETYWPSPATSSGDFERLLSVNRSNHQGFVAERTDGGIYAHYAGTRAEDTIRSRALFLHNLEPANYGSFLFRQLPQLLLLRELPLAFDVYIVPDRTHWLREALQLVGLPLRPILTVREVAGTKFDAINFFNEFDAEGFFSESVANRALALSRTVWPPKDATSANKLFISRRLGTINRPDYRPLLNDLEVEESVRKRGFTVIYPEVLSLSEQIGMFRGATAIAGPSGSGMLNSIFAEPGARILDMESFHYTVRQHAKIYSSTKKDYAFLFGTIDHSEQQPAHLAPWTVNTRLLEEGLEWLQI